MIEKIQTVRAFRDLAQEFTEIPVLIPELERTYDLFVEVPRFMERCLIEVQVDHRDRPIMLQRE